MMDPELYKAAKKGYVSRLSGIHGENRTEEEAMNNQHGEFLKRTQHGNNNILHVAARSGHDNFVAEALRRFPFLSDQMNSQRDTPLLVAARFGHVEVVKVLAKFPMQDAMATAVEINIGTNSSSRRRQGEVEEGLVDHQWDVLIPSHWRVTNQQGTTVTTALHEALRNGREEVARYLLELKPEIAAFDNLAGESPLFLAAESGCQSFMLDILQSGRPYSAQGPDGRTVLHATRDRYDTIASKLITQKPDLMRQLDKRGKAAIHYAIEADYWGLVDKMLEADATIALLPDADGYTPLLRACSRGCWKVCQKMLELCPESIEARNHKGQNALHLCKFTKYRELKFFMIPEIEELVSVGDDEGNTPLHLAVKENAHLKAMFLLSTPLEIDVWAVNKEGLTAFDIWETFWMNSNRQLQVTRWMWIPIFMRYKAKHGRRSNENKVSVEGQTATPQLKPVTKTMSLVATLIATVTFAAAFTMPGGFDSSPGKYSGVAILVNKAALRAFILSDTIAVCCSITVVFLLMWALILGNDAVLASISMLLLSYALLATLVAFISGIFAVIAPKALGVAILVCVLCFMVPFALSLTEFLNTFALLVFPIQVIMRDFFEPIRRKLIKKAQRQRDVVRSLGQRRYPDTTYRMSNTNTEV